MNPVRASLSGREDRESSFYRCGGPVCLVEACLWRERPDNAVLTSNDVLRSTCRPVQEP